MSNSNPPSKKRKRDNKNNKPNDDNNIPPSKLDEKKPNSPPKPPSKPSSFTPKYQHRFNRPLNNGIPSSVTHLGFGYFFDKHINNQISSVKYLTLGGRFTGHIGKDMLNNLIDLRIEF